MRSSVGVLFLDRCVERLHYCAHNTDKSPLKIVPSPIIFVKDPHIRLKRKKLGPAVKLREERRRGP